MSSGPAERIALLRQLYAQQLTERPDDAYLREHSQDHFVAGTERVFRFVSEWVPAGAHVLDWGCNHAPDSCLLRHERGDSIDLEACDVVAPGTFRVFHDYARFRYSHLLSPSALPYGDDSFDVVIASGVLEHVPLMNDSLRELYRILRLGGRLVVTYLPNRLSVQEWRLRRRRTGEHHKRLQTLWGFRSTLRLWGFDPLTIGYQTKLDLLRGDDRSWQHAVLEGIGARHLTSCLCAVATKVPGL